MIRWLITLVALLFVLFLLIAGLLVSLRFAGAPISDSEARLVAAIISVIGSAVLTPLTARYDVLQLPSGFLRKIKWERVVPFFRTIPRQTQEEVMTSLNALLSDVTSFLNDRGVTSYTPRANVLLPNPYFKATGELPGQLAFFLHAPVGAYETTELRNRFSPGEGVSGKVFLEGGSFAERGRHGVSQEKFELMPRSLAYVLAIALKLPSDSARPFGVVSIDFLAGAGQDVTPQEEASLRALLAIPAVTQKVASIAEALSYKKHPSFKLSIQATAPPESG